MIMKFMSHILKFTKQIIGSKHLHCAKMACSRYEYVKGYEKEDTILPNVWIVIRVDGKGFHEFSKAHDFEKPNDENALNLMNAAAIAVMKQFNDIILAYGQSDEYSFIFRKETNVFNRREAKLLSYVTSLFTSTYVMQWSQWFGEKRKLLYAPCFDGRVVLYPSNENLRDYLSWRQADVHINNLYNTAFWNLVQQAGMSNQQAEAELRGTFSADKNELLFSRFNINYNQLPAMYRKGTTLLRKRVKLANNSDYTRQLILPLHEDMIKEKFWNTHVELLGKYKPRDYDINIDETISRLLKLQIQEIEKKKTQNAEKPEIIELKT